MMSYVNAARKARGIGPLKHDKKLQYWAQKHAVWMSKNGYRHSNYPWSECIHHRKCTAKICVRDWINSHPHCAILMSGTKVGFGSVDRSWWVAEISV